jgi:protein gp37
LIVATPNLDWLMLTKRPQLIASLAPYKPHMWHGVTAENQRWLDIRWEHLKRVESEVYWLSMEPLMEAVTLPADFLALGKRAWVIVGGESGGHARPMHPDWARSLRDQCQAAGVPYHLKQWGEWAPREQFGSFAEWDAASAHALVGPDGAFTAIAGRDKPDPEFGLTCADLDGNDYAAAMARVGKKAAGRTLDGRTWDEFPLEAK